MSLKSISPFIASVLLISFTIASGIIVYYFLTTLPKVQTTEVSSQASKVLSCAGVTFDVKVRNCNLLNGLVLWLPMDEGSGNIAYDYSGNNNHGTLYNGPAWVDGKIGKALNFSQASNQRVVVNDPLSLRVNDYTIVFWIKFTNGPDEGWRQILAKHASSCPWADRSPGIWICPSVLGLHWRHSPDNSGSWCLGFDGEGTNFQLNTPYFYFIAGSKSGSNLKLQFSNTTHWKTYTYSVVNPMCQGSGNFYVGATGWASQGMIIDDVRVYNRVLNDDEIKQLYYDYSQNKFNITIGLLNFGYADLGKSFNAIVYLKNGTILQLPLVLDNNLNKGYYLEKTLTIDGYYPSYGLVDKIMVCSNDCQGVCSEIIVNNQC
jgi:hypothetical protein